MPCSEQRERRPVVEPVRNRERQLRRRRRVLRVAARAGQRDHALAGVLAHPRDLAAGHQRQRRLAHVGVRPGVRVREVQPRARHADQHLARRGSRPGSSTSSSTSGPPNSVIWIARIGAEASASRRAPPPRPIGRSEPRERRHPPSYIVPAHVHHRRRIDRLRHRHDALRRARPDARRRRRALRAGGLLLRGGPRRRTRRRGLRRGRARRDAPSRRRHLRRRARPRRQDLLLARQVRLGPQLARDARHPARRLRGLPAEALRGLARERRAVPREHPARPAARRARAAARRALRRAGLDEPLDRSRARLARQGDRAVRLPDPQRLRAAPAHRQGEPARRRARDLLLGPPARHA